jgi:Rod binding domain-containing protein
MGDIDLTLKEVSLLPGQSLGFDQAGLWPISDISDTFTRQGVEKLQGVEVDKFSEEKKRQVAKNFESVLINKLFDQVQNTIGDWDFDDGASKQIHGLFWLYLAQDIADKGGFGLWKDIYKFLTQSK